MGWSKLQHNISNFILYFYYIVYKNMSSTSYKQQVCHYYITIIFTLLHLNLYWIPVIVVTTIGIMLMTTVVILGVICCIVQLRKKRWSDIWNYNHKFILYFYNFLYRSILSTRYNQQISYTLHYCHYSVTLYISYEDPVQLTTDSCHISNHEVCTLIYVMILS